MEIGTQHVLFAWSDIQEYRSIPTVDYRFTKAKQVRCCGWLSGATGHIPTRQCTNTTAVVSSFLKQANGFVSVFME